MQTRIISLFVAVISMATVMFSCEDALEAPTKSSVDEAILFSTPRLAEGAITGILQSFCENNAYRGRYIGYYGFNTDCEVIIDLRNKGADNPRLSNYNTNVNNTWMGTPDNILSRFYEGIERANLAIRGLRTYGDVENNEELAQILGEALTLRAVLYGDLIKAHGDVPARFEPIDPNDLNHVFLPKSDRDTIYKQLLADLEEAATLVAWPNETDATRTTEKINKAFVKGFRARLALAAGGYSQRADGIIRLSKDLDLAPDKMYAIAKQECLDVINSGKCHLLPTFEEVFRTLCDEKCEVEKESIWEIPFSEGRGRVIFDMGVKHTTTDDHTGQAKGGINGPNPIMFYAYDAEDSRRDVTCIPYEWTGGKQVPTNLDKWYFGKYRYEWLSRRVTATNDDGLNWMYMRYADVLLMAAEAINELNGPAEAAPYLRQVRERAYKGHEDMVDTYINKVKADKKKFFNAIVDERALEFTGEMLRKGDLIRWDLLGSKLKEARTKLEQLNESVPKTVYYRNDGENVVFYGLERGEDNPEAAGFAYTGSVLWALPADYSAALYLREPDTQQFWPIWQVFIDASNGVLNNEGYQVPSN